MSATDNVLEDTLRLFIREHRREEKHRHRRQELEAELRRLVGGREIRRMQAERDAGCPPAFREACVLPDGTRCPFYHDGLCVKAEGATK